MSIIKCKMCGGELDFKPNCTIATCQYCGTQQTVPTDDNEKKLIQFERADRLRRNCEFDKASGIYESIVADFRHEAEAYWGLILCKYGIEYVDDPATGEKIPTCHRCSFESVMDDPNFELTIENADPLSLPIYRREAKKIDMLCKNIIELSSNEDSYDIFICYKETDINGQRTIDSLIAQDIYDALTEKGYRVFFSRITLEDKLGISYEPYIFSALNHAKIMLVVGTSYEHFNAVWVKNEWGRFLKFMATDKTKRLIPCYKNIDAYDIPREFAHLQAQDMGKVGALQDLLRGIDKILPRNIPAPTPAPVPAPTPTPVPAEPIRKQAPVIITNVCSIGTRTYNDLWPTGQPRTVFNYDEYNVIAFWVNVVQAKLASRKTVTLKLKIYNAKNIQVLDNAVTLAWASNYDRLSQTYNIRGSDGTVVPTGKYRAEFQVDESAVYEYTFTVTSNEEIRQARQAATGQQQDIVLKRRRAGLCQHCGGPIKKGLFSKKCMRCGRSLDY